MTRKTIFTASAVGLITFLLGWLLHSIIMHPDKATDVVQSEGFTDTIRNADARKFKVPTDFNNNTISGRFILAQSNCAGFNFIDTTTVLWTNEIACDDPDTLRIRWLDNKTFMTKSTVKTSEHCPPMVDIYKVVSFDGKHLTLKSVETGWADSKNENLDFLEFTRQSN